MSKVYIVGGMRTPIGRTGGVLRSFLPEQLASIVLNAVIEKYSLSPLNIDQVMLGNAAGPGGNIARVSVLEAGWPYSIPGITVDFQCGSGLSSVSLAASQILACQADMIVAGGVESTSMAPKRQFNPNDPRYKGENIYYERAPFSIKSAGDPEMLEGAENVAKFKNITREDMDELALESHRKAYNTVQEGILKDIIIPVECNGKLIDSDECIRPKISLKLLQRMPSAFETNGKITAGNACLMHDGAAVVLLASEHAVEKFKLKPEAILLDSCFTGSNPNFPPLGPVDSIRKILLKNSLALENIDAVEINEAFAVKILACCRELGLERGKTNILGGALAYGHPYGASGTIIILHLIKALKKIDGKIGLASIGVAGGQGASVLIYRT